MSNVTPEASIFSLLTADESIKGRLAKIGGQDLVAAVEAKAREESESPAVTELTITPTPALVRCALTHSFQLSDFDASAEEQEVLLAHSDLLTVAGVRRLRLRDDVRAKLLDEVASSSLLSDQLQQNADKDVAILSSDRSDPEELTSAWTRTLVRGHTHRRERPSIVQLRAVVTACDSLRSAQSLSPRLPTLADLKRQLDLAELLEPLRILIGDSGSVDLKTKDRFVGREKELKRLRSFVDVLASESGREVVERGAYRIGRTVASAFGVSKPKLMVLAARGGLGKSTLIAKFVLDHALTSSKPFPFTHLDFDRAALHPRSAAQLVIETARQGALQFPTFYGELSGLKERLRSDLAHATTINLNGYAAELRETLQRILKSIDATTFLLVLDTVEVVQSDPQALRGVCDFLGALVRDGFPELCVVVAGRADVPELRDPDRFNWWAETLALGSLSMRDARAMVDLLGRSLMGEYWEPKWAGRIAGPARAHETRREPLTLRVAVEFVRNAVPQERAKLVAEIKDLGEAANEEFVGRIYVRRILDHIGDIDARKLAWPGLIVRRITPTIAREVLAPLCELASDRVDHAFNWLAREVWIVDRDGDGLRHRQDLRARTLPLMRRHNPHTFQQVCTEMARHLSEPGRNREDYIESLYYLLLRGDHPRTLPELGAHELAALGSASDDFERGSEAWCYLESRLATRLLPRESLELLPDDMAWGHIVSVGSGLRGFNEERIDLRVLDLIEREGDSATNLKADIESARQSIFIKAGCWRRLEQTSVAIPTDPVDLVAFSYYIARRSGERLDQTSKWLKEITEGGSWQALALSLPLAQTVDLGLHATLDERLTRLLSESGIGAGGPPGAVRAATIFGAKCLSQIFNYWETVSQRGGRLMADSIAAEELSILLEKHLLTETIQIELRERSGMLLKELQTGEAGVPGELVKARITDSELLVVARKALIDLIVLARESFKPDSIDALRRFFAVRNPDWVVPLGYTVARLFAGKRIPSEVMERVSLYSELGSNRVGNIAQLFGSRERSRDPIRILRIADEAGDLLGIVDYIRSLPREELPGDALALNDLDLMTTALRHYREVTNTTISHMSQSMRGIP